MRAAALDALLATGREAPFRLAHALFHPDARVRLATLALDLPTPARRLAAYLRGDPACAERAAELPWPDDPLALAFDLHAGGRITATALIELVLQLSTAELRRFLDKELGRNADMVEAYIADAVRAPSPLVAPGRDALDILVSALDAAGIERSFEHVIEAVTPRKARLITRRAAAAMLSYVAARRTAGAPVSPILVGAAVALEPRLLGAAGFDRAQVDAVVAALTRFKWPVRPPVPQVERLLALPLVRTVEGDLDLALAAALAGLLPGQRLATIARLFGEPVIARALVLGDRGWDAICRLPPEKPALELAWLQRVERLDLERYKALVAQAMAILPGPRLDAFVEQLPRHVRAGALIDFAGAAAGATESQRTAVCKAVAGRLDRVQILHALHTLLASPPVAPPSPAHLTAVELVRVLPEKPLLAAVADLADDTVERLLDAVDLCGGLLWSREVELATALRARPAPRIAAWAEHVLRAAGTRPAVPPPVLRTRRQLTRAERDRITTAPSPALPRALEPAMAAPSAGLCQALAARTAEPCLPACAALLACVDPIDQVARQLDRFAGGRHGPATFDEALDNAAAAWLRTDELPPLAHARLWRWEAHQVALGKWVDSVGGLRVACDLADTLPGRVARETLWHGLSELTMFWRFRDPGRISAHGLDAVIEVARFCAERVDQDIGRHAARLLVALVEVGAVSAITAREGLLDRAADADAPTREYLSRLVRLEGLPTPPPVERPPTPARELIDAIRASDSLDELAVWCADPRPAVVEEAALRLVLLGDVGQGHLAALLPTLDVLPAPLPILASIALWESPAAVAAARALADTAALPPAWQFHLCLGLCARGDSDMLPRALAALRVPAPPPPDGEPAPRSWFRRDDWTQLTRVAHPLICALAAVESPHHHAYQPALHLLLERTEPPEVADALRRYLELDGVRPQVGRVTVAARLAFHWDDVTGLPILLDELATSADELDVKHYPWLTALLPGAVATLLDGLTGAALLGGHGVCTEKRLMAVLAYLRTEGSVTVAQVAPIYRRVLEEGSTAAARRACASFASEASRADERLLRVAETFAWGVRRGVELTGKLYRIHMTGAERELGHTRLDGTRIFVTPLPMLREEMYGRDVVEGLILHELGHHVYHTGEGAPQIWKQAENQGLFPLLNLVADEHLERNLRAVEPAYGDRLKRLGAYAFQHAAQEIAVPVLLGCLRGATARALIGGELEVAFDEAALRVRRGAVLSALDHAGHPLARFCRALRLGLGNRHGDPLVARALAMCGGIRRLDMAGLWALTRALAELFGSAAAVAQVFGGPEGMSFGERESDVFGAGIDDEILQREVERILDPRQRKSDGKREQGPPHLAINVNEAERFDPIRRIERVRGDDEAHRHLAHGVARHASRLRVYLDELGLRWLPVRARLAGRALDRTRLRALVTRNDPRLLVARTPVRRTDLFLGTVIDCSGSMQAGQNIERAKRFAVLIAEAVRPINGVEARFFGFTDSVIYDAGDARDCAVTALQAGGGNNDAAALYHAATAAAASQRRAKVIVMISDGLPTECSVAALRGLVKTLTRRKGIICAQVAVRKLEEVCFPHYVVLDDDNVDLAVARFGRMIADLARRGLAS